MMTESNRPLSEVLNALALAMPVPNAGILGRLRLEISGACQRADRIRGRAYRQPRRKR